jgi:hypothetical protein
VFVVPKYGLEDQRLKDLPDAWIHVGSALTSRHLPSTMAPLFEAKLQSHKWGGQTYMKSKQWSEQVRLLISAAITVFSLVLCGIYVLRPTVMTNWRLDGKTLGFLVVAALPWVIERLESFKGFGFEFKQRLDKQDKVIEQQQELINLMFWFSMEADMFDTLKNLVEAPTFFHNPEETYFYPIVHAQLKELFNRGYIDRDPATLVQAEDIGSGRIVTDVGKRFVYRKKLEAAGAREKLQELSPLAATGRSTKD